MYGADMEFILDYAPVNLAPTASGELMCCVCLGERIDKGGRVQMIWTLPHLGSRCAREDFLVW